MATTLQEILERYEHEHASTYAVIAAMPDAHASFRPHERSLSWGQLAWHLAITPLYYVSEVFKLPTRLGWDLDSARPPSVVQGHSRAARPDHYGAPAARHAGAGARLSPRIGHCQLIERLVRLQHNVPDSSHGHTL
jgi:hypothetical protein